MALIDEVKGRISEGLLRELTNQGDTTATGINDTVLAYAVTDAEGEFLVETGLALDSSSAKHVAAGVVGVIYYLYSYSGLQTETADRQRQRWERLMLKIDSTEGGGRRIMPDTTSTLTPTAERVGARPDFERSRWGDYVPRMPVGDDSDDNDRISR